MSIINKIVLAVDGEGKEHKVLIIDKSKMPYAGIIIDMYLCLNTDASTFYTNNIKRFYTSKEQIEIRQSLFKEFGA